MKETDKVSKESVSYEVPAKGNDECKDCVHYHNRQCDLVKGSISPNGWCELFSRKR